MAVRCSKCGEELLGPVNRCWKCGQQFSAQAEVGGLPPVRYAPLELPSDVVLAEVAGEAAATSASAVANVPAPQSAPQSVPAPGNSIRTGSPFVRGAVMQAVATQAFPRKPLTPGASPRIPGPPGHDPVAVAGAIASIVMGLFALGLAWMKMPVAIAAAVIVALVGFSLGIWGLYSKRRGWALFGILISCAAIGLATYTASILVYQSMREQEDIQQSDPTLLP
jgi:hypothetical protein